MSRRRRRLRTRSRCSGLAVARCSAVVYTHPTDAACCQGLLPRVPNQMLEYPMDTTRTIASLIVSDTATRCPDVRFIFSHAGGDDKND